MQPEFIGGVVCAVVSIVLIVLCVKSHRAQRRAERRRMQSGIIRNISKG